MNVLEAVALGLKNSKYTVAFTGAGISSESGIPTFRGEDGLWKEYDPDLYANINHFNQNPTYYWNFFKDIRYPLLKKAKPNPGHLALAEMESAGNLKTVITQNIDGLHQGAGSSSVIELHGTTRVIYCMNCFEEYALDDVFARIETENPPFCLECQGNLRPDVVFFGESLDSQVLTSAYQEARICDFLLVVGSSLVVYPASHIPLHAKQAGAALAIINKEPTPFDDLADYVNHEEAGTALPRIVQLLA